MLKKEWRDIFMPMLLRLMVGPVLALMQAVFAGEVNVTTSLLFFIGYVVSVFWVALNMGLNAFHSEFNDHAFEYLLTFPFRRLRLLAVKFAARLLILVFLLSFYCFLHSILKINPLLRSSNLLNSPLFNSFAFSFWALLYFVIGFFLSLVDWGSARPAIPLVILAGHIMFTLFIEKSIRNLGSFHNGLVLSGILLMIATGFFFTFCFRQLRRGKLGNGWYKRSKKSLPLFVHQNNGRNWGLLRHEIRIVAQRFFMTALFSPVLFFLFGKGRITVEGKQHSLFDPVFSITVIAAFLIIFFAFSSGYGLFYREFRHKALEYLLTFPLSFRRILTEKLLARILVLSPAVIAYMIFAGHFFGRLALGTGFLYNFLHPEYFPFWVALMLLNGLFLSLFEMKNMMALVSLANLYTIVSVPLAVAGILKRFSLAVAPQAMTVLVFGSGFLLTTLILGIAFSKVWQRFDLAAPHRYTKAFGLFLFIALTSVSLASLAIIIFI